MIWSALRMAAGTWDTADPDSFLGRTGKRATAIGKVTRHEADDGAGAPVAG